jgi:hypothetical protein
MYDEHRNAQLVSRAASHSGDRRSQSERTLWGSGVTSVVIALTTDATYGSVCVLKPSAPSGNVGATPATGSGATATVDAGENSLPNTTNAPGRRERQRSFTSGWNSTGDCCGISLRKCDICMCGG